MHEPPYLLGSGRELRDAEHVVESLGCRQMMGYRADTAQTLHHHRHLPIGAALYEFFEAAKFDDV